MGRVDALVCVQQLTWANHTQLNRLSTVKLTTNLFFVLSLSDKQTNIPQMLICNCQLFYSPLLLQLASNKGILGQVNGKIIRIIF